MKTRAIAAAKVKTDKVDAAVLAQLLAADFVPDVWVPSEATHMLRRQVPHRASLVSQRTALRNRVHGILQRDLVIVSVGSLVQRAKTVASNCRGAADVCLASIRDPGLAHCPPVSR